MAVTYNTRPTNGVSWNVSHELTAGDASDGTVIFDFQTEFDLDGVVQIRSATGDIVPLTDEVITYPAAGQISIAESTAGFTAGQFITVIANRKKAV